MRHYPTSAIRLPLVAALLLAVAACGPRRIHEEPIMANGDRILPPDGTIQQMHAGAIERRGMIERERDSITALATSSCAAATCTAIARGEVTLGMSLDQVMAATRTTLHAWTVRDAGGSTVMVPRTLNAAPRDIVGDVGMVQLTGGRVGSISYREPQGLRVVDSPAGATSEARVAARASALVREGDDLIAAGSVDAALNRYDRALVLLPNDASLQYKTALILDQRLRPVEALMRYQRFLHQMELEKINAQGEANAKMAEAIARARERVIVLEKQTR